MPSSDSTERLNILTQRATRSLRSLLGRSTLAATVPVPFASTSTSQRSSRVSGLNGNIPNGIALLDDERQIRALAKEIKRLISEDARRGLKV